jgi:hypothetical protein
MKEFYDINKLKRREHPFRDKIKSGELKTRNYMDAPDAPAKIAALEPTEREVLELFLQRKKEITA